jgi:F0F1-type ATP synthase delta subunit
MAHEQDKTTSSKPGQLPPSVASPAEINRLRRELSVIDNALLEHTLRKSGGNAEMLKTSHLMDKLVEVNQLSLLHKEDRQRLARFLEAVSARAPVLHISFSTDPAPAFLERLMAWLRQNIHPQALVTVGVQPTIAAGCVVRTTNKYFDLSLGQDFANKRELLLQQITKQQPKKATA